MRPFRVVICLAFASCATLKNGGDLEALKPAVETFHQRARWRDYRGAAELVVPEKRVAFLRARDSQHDDKDLHITDYQLEDAQVLPSLTEAIAVSKVSWYRLPSVSETSALVESRFVWRDGAWLLDGQSGGPFASELSLGTR